MLQCIDCKKWVNYRIYGRCHECNKKHVEFIREYERCEKQGKRYVETGNIDCFRMGGEKL
jgi:hypothetical protein